MNNKNGAKGSDLMIGTKSVVVILLVFFPSDRPKLNNNLTLITLILLKHTMPPKTMSMTKANHYYTASWEASFFHQH